MYGGVGYSAWWEAPPKIGGCSRCARPAGTLAAEKYVLAGGAGQNMIASFSAGCGRRNSARRALPGESVGRKGGLGPSGLFAGCRPDLLGVPYRASRWGGKISGALWVFLRAAARTCWVCPPGRVGGAAGVGYPKGGFPYPKAFPSGGRCSSAHTGADEGAIPYPTFPCRSRKRGLPAVASTRFFYCPVGQVDRPLISHLR